jgi:ABC-type bacteriocin/lantibiotic exporter with double-glycine peptidase domain
MAEVSNDVLAEMLRGITVKSDERHGENRARLDEIVRQTTATNGRLRIAETTIAQHTWAFMVMGAGAVVWLGVWLAKVL